MSLGNFTIEIFHKIALLLCRWPLLMRGTVLPLVHALALFFSFLDLVISAVAFKSSVRETAPIVWLVYLDIRNTFTLL